MGQEVDPAERERGRDGTLGMCSSCAPRWRCRQILLDENKEAGFTLDDSCF